MSRFSQTLARQYRYWKSRLTQIRDTPHAIAGGVAIGLLFGFTPLLGFKTLLAVLIAWLFRCSKLSAALAVTFHDILLPIWPLILRYQFQLGYWVLSNPHHFAPKLHRGDFKPSEIFQWNNLIDIGLPLTVGGIVFAIPCALISYAVVLTLMRLRMERRQKLGSEKNSA